MFKNLIMITLLSFMIGCSATTSKQAKNSCANHENIEERYRCYQLDLRATINDGLRPDIEDWFRYKSRNPYTRLRGAVIGIQLNTKGEIQKVEILKTSGVVSFDNMLLKSINLNSPYKMPKEIILNRKFLHFTWEIEI